MIEGYSFFYLEDKNEKILNEDKEFLNYHPYGSLNWALAKNDKFNKSFLINIQTKDNSFSINGFIKKKSFINFVYIQSGILYRSLEPSVEDYNQIFLLIKKIFKDNLKGLLILRYEPIYVSNNDEKKSLILNKFIPSKIRNISGYSRIIESTKMSKKIKKETSRVKKSDIKISSNVPLNKDDFECIINLHNEMSEKKSLDQDKWITKPYLQKLIKYFGKKINIIKAYKGNVLVGYSLWLDTNISSIYFRGATSRECGSLGVGYSLVQTKVEKFLENDNSQNHKFIDLGGIGKQKRTAGVDKFKSRFNSYEIEYLGPYDYTSSYLGRLLLELLFLLLTLKKIIRNIKNIF